MSRTVTAFALRATALFASVLVSSVMPASATLYACKNSLSAEGRGRDTGIATRAAIFNWHIRAEDAYGKYYGNYSRSIGRGRRCGDEDGVGIKLCVVWGKPCYSGPDASGGVNKNPQY
jgi:hypothetical protein